MRDLFRILKKSLFVCFVLILLPFVLGNETELVNEIPTLNNSTDLVQEDVVFEEVDSCSKKSLRTCEVFNELGITTGLSVPFIIPKNGIINMYFFNETIIGHIIVDKGLISEIVCCSLHDVATHEAKIIDFESVERIRTSHNFLDEAHQLLIEGNITLSASSFSDSARLTIGKAVARIYSWFT